MRIAAFSSFPAWPTHHGGAARVAAITQGLAAHSHRVRLYYLSHERRVPRRYPQWRYRGVLQSGLKIDVSDEMTDHFSFWDVNCAKFIHKTGYNNKSANSAQHWADIILCFQVYPMPLIEATSKPVILDMMDAESDLKAVSFPDDVELRETVFELEASALSKASHLLTTTEDDFFSLQKRYNLNSNNFTLAPNGTQVQVAYRYTLDQRTEAKRRLNLPTDQPAALYFASGHPPNAKVAEYIAGRLAHDCPEVNFILAGTVTWAVEHHQKVPNVFLIPDPQPALGEDIYTATDLGLNPVHEALPASDVKVLDYLAHGIPVAATERGVRGHGMEVGTHYYPMDQDPAGATWKVGHDENLANHLSFHGLEYVNSRTWEKTVDKIEAALDIIKRGGKSKINTSAIKREISPLEEYSERSEVVWSTPSEICFDLTNDCHIRCVHCYRTYQENSATYLSMDIFKRIPDRYYRNARQIDLSGMGEPMLHPDWVKILDYIDSRSDATLTFNTSLTVWNREKLNQMVRLNTIPSISIDAARKETFERIRKRSRYEKVFDGLRQLMEICRQYPESEFRPRIQWTLYRDNVAELHEFIDIAADMGVNEVRVQPLAPHQPEMLDWVCDPTDPKTEEYLLLALEKAKTNKISLTLYDTLRFTDRIETLHSECQAATHCLHDIIPIHDAPSSKGCSYPWTQMNIDSSGQVVACCFSDYQLGNLYEKELDAIWNNSHFQKLRREVNENSLCTYCVDSPSGGVCCPRIQYLRTSHKSIHWLQENATAHA